ncbi:hypothetical protein F4777DRAFT_592574 [Nemania sp. FL0916]|nr:hypothetical protein F4777DRAFT_592574 [Nemania sp. FL0916]
MVPSLSKKRIIVCCDGTWQNSDNGHAKSNSKTEPRLQIPSNFQIIYYQSGVGSRSGFIDRVFGGAFGIGIAENIREAYAFLCANYVDGDDIVLLGFSRGAFTARSIGGMISDLGLLTREGMEFFYPIFKDMQNWTNDHYDDPVKGNNGQGRPIRVLAIDIADIVVGVWDTVGSLGVPDERRPQEKGSSDLRQVWFPGSHANIGGGWPDQGVADTTLAWMMDQLSSVGCEFQPNALERAFASTVRYYTHQEQERAIRRSLKKSIWAAVPIYESNKPIRPWALHSIQSATSPLYNLVGSVSRAPGMYKRINPKNGRPLPEFLEDTNERIHPSVRVRLACEGLGLNDWEIWHCPSLLKYWRPRRVPQQFSDPVPRRAEWGPSRTNSRVETTTNMGEQSGSAGIAASASMESLQMLSQDPSERWVWVYTGPEATAPAVKMMVEENLGPFEQRLLELAAGKVHVYKYAEEQDVNELKAFHLRSFRKMMRRLHKKWHSEMTASEPTGEIDGA